ncbi:DUF4352 domain-containing protein [Haladaptatus caseinilyticus]|uniref:DUF4352 domain-containing protein n=1 Tax=Haladaptatus caseinilyticus TaxID=2993314 RepID=UPI00224AE817|nr:DUF4352 domain-containing protein [Haladaptatus caseinilyticus]
MKRRTFIGWTAGAVFLAGCSSSGDDTGSSTTGTEQSTTKRATGTTAGETTASKTTADGTTTETTTSESSTTTDETRTVAFGESATVGDGLEVAVTEANTSGSYEHGETTTKSGAEKTFLVVTFETKNSAQSAQSLPEGTAASVRTNEGQYELADAATERWQQYVSTSVRSGESASATVAFEVPKDAASSFDLAVVVSYSESGTKRVVQWRMD